MTTVGIDVVPPVSGDLPAIVYEYCFPFVSNEPVNVGTVCTFCAHSTPTPKTTPKERKTDKLRMFLSIVVHSAGAQHALEQYLNRRL